VSSRGLRPSTATTAGVIAGRHFNGWRLRKSAEDSRWSARSGVYVAVVACVGRDGLGMWQSDPARASPWRTLVLFPAVQTEECIAFMHATLSLESARVLHRGARDYSLAAYVHKP
jgi:hypothetical protein